MGFPFGYLLFAGSAWALANHFFEILEHKAEGRDGWPAFSFETLVGGRQQIGLAFVALLAALGALYWVIGRSAGASTVMLVGVVGAAALPATAALLGVTRSFARSVDPRAIARAAARLGLDYLALLLMTAVVIGAAFVVQERRTLLTIFAASYLWLALGYFLGGLVYERRVALGVHAPRSPEALRAAEDARTLRARAAALDHAYGVARANVAGSLDYIERYAAGEPDPLAAKVWFFNAMTRWTSSAPAVALAATLKPALEAAGRDAEAAKVALTCRYFEDRPNDSRAEREPI